jgi:hypothetical protein
MARSKNQSNGHLEQAIAILIQNQAAFLAQKAETDREVAELRRESDRLQRENAERFARIEAILMEHSRILRALPDAIRDKIGFKIPEKTASSEEKKA